MTRPRQMAYPLLAWLLVLAGTTGTWLTVTRPDVAVHLNAWECGWSTSGPIVVVGSTLAVVTAWLGSRLIATVVAWLALLLTAYVLFDLPELALWNFGGGEASLGWGAGLAAVGMLALAVLAPRVGRDRRA